MRSRPGGGGSRPGRLVLGAVVAGAVVVQWSACAHEPPPEPSASPLLGRPLPTPRGALLSGEPVDSVTLMRRTVVVKFFAEYCKPCLRSLPDSVSLARKHPEVLFLGISVDEQAEAAIRQIRRFKLPYPVLHDPSHAMAGRFRVTELPAVFVADASGQVVWTGGPGHPDDALERVLAQLAQR